MATTKRRSEPPSELEGTRKKFKLGNIFSWTDDEIELSLGVVETFKPDKQGEWIDWESVKTKYEDIRTIMKPYRHGVFTLRQEGFRFRFIPTSISFSFYTIFKLFSCRQPVHGWLIHNDFAPFSNHTCIM